MSYENITFPKSKDYVSYFDRLKPLPAPDGENFYVEHTLQPKSILATSRVEIPNRQRDISKKKSLTFEPKPNTTPVTHNQAISNSNITNINHNDIRFNERRDAKTKKSFLKQGISNYRENVTYYRRQLKALFR